MECLERAIDKWMKEYLQFAPGDVLVKVRIEQRPPAQLEWVITG